MNTWKIELDDLLLEKLTLKLLMIPMLHYLYYIS